MTKVEKAIIEELLYRPYNRYLFVVNTDKNKQVMTATDRDTPKHLVLDIYESADYEVLYVFDLDADDLDRQVEEFLEISNRPSLVAGTNPAL